MQCLINICTIMLSIDLLVLLPVDDDGGDLLVHEEEDDGQQGEHWRQDHVHPPGIR
jgi:hypothetical protein